MNEQTKSMLTNERVEGALKEKAAEADQVKANKESAKKPKDEEAIR